MQFCPPFLILVNMKELDINFKFKGDEFTRIDKTDNAYLYERNHNGVLYYEVFPIRETEILLDFDLKIGSGEFKHRYPGANDFGVWAWCYKENILKAYEKLESL